MNRLGQLPGDGVLSTELCEKDGRRMGRWVLEREEEMKGSAWEGRSGWHPALVVLLVEVADLK